MIQPAPPRPAVVQVPDRSWSHATNVLVTTLRAFLRAESRREVATVLQATVGHLGGGVIAARKAAASDLPVDVSLGVGEPLVVRPPVDASDARFLVENLAAVVEDALSAAHRIDRYQRETLRATVDTLTKVATRAEVGTRIGLSASGDAVCMLDLDNFKVLNDTHGHAAGDAALRHFGALLLGSIRDDDFVGRTGGDEFVVVLRGIPLDVAHGRMRLLCSKWRISRHCSGTTVSAGIAVVDHRGGATAAGAADKAMYRAKGEGRGLVELAVSDDYDGE